MNQRVGTCALCGGDVVGHRGAWMAITPPGPDTCASCGAVAATDVIPMVKKRNQSWPTTIANIDLAKKEPTHAVPTT